MNMLKSIAYTGIVGAGLLVAAPQDAEAGNFYLGFGNTSSYQSGYGHGGYGYGNHGGYGNYGRSFGNSYGGYGHRWHDTSHYDYHPGSYQRHNNHYDYVPGHYDYHRSGHMDHYGH